MGGEDCEFDLLGERSNILLCSSAQFLIILLLLSFHVMSLDLIQIIQVDSIIIALSTQAGAWKYQIVL